MRGKQRRKITREDLLDSMMEGEARNALDCALWDLEAKQAGKAVCQLAGLPAPQPLTTAYTVSLGDPPAQKTRMAEDPWNSSDQAKVALPYTPDSSEQPTAEPHSQM